MSQWGATVITSLASAQPVVGTSIVGWLWGGFAVDNPTQNRFYSFHYLFPFLQAAQSQVHLAALHQYGSTNPLGIQAQTDLVDFYPYFYSKDLGATLRLRMFATFQVAFYPEAQGHPDNNIPANPYATPAHIVPEWYFLWVYAILRSIPNKLAGVRAIGLVFAALAALPYLHKPAARGPIFRSMHKALAWALIGDFMLLTYLGQQPVERPFVLLGQQATVLFFALLGALCVAAWADSYQANFSSPIVQKNKKFAHSFFSAEQKKESAHFQKISNIYSFLFFYIENFIKSKRNFKNKRNRRKNILKIFLFYSIKQKKK